MARSGFLYLAGPVSRSAGRIGRITEHGLHGDIADAAPRTGVRSESSLSERRNYSAGLGRQAWSHALARLAPRRSNETEAK